MNKLVIGEKTTLNSKHKCALKNRPSAFTLIELIVVVAIIAILASIAYPSYDRYIVRSKRADAMSALMLAAQSYERFRANTFNYNTAVDNIFTDQVPVEGGVAYYTLKNTAQADGGYTITATPVGSMAGKEGPLTLTNTGVRTWEDENGITNQCWPAGGNSC